MSQRQQLGFYLVILIGLLLNSHSLGAEQGPTLHLHRTAVYTTSGKTAVLAQNIPDYHIVQFDAPITPQNRSELLLTGVEIVEYLPDFAYLVQGSSVQLTAVQQLESLYAIEPFLVADKLSPALFDFDWESELTVMMLDWRGWVLAETAVTSLTQLALLATNPEVRWIEPKPTITTFNGRAREVTNVNGVWQSYGFFGAGQIVAVTDSGLDTGDPNTLSPDFAGRIVAAHPLVEGASWNDEFGHGTHVAGSLLGSGVQSGADPSSRSYEDSHAGVAPEASLVVQAFETTTEGTVVGINPDLYVMYQQVYEDGARIHSNSWGGPTGPDGESLYGGYPFMSQRTDAFIYDNPDMTIFFAAGNSGTDCEDFDGVVDKDSLAAPGTAKNVITVGATEGDRNNEGASSAFWWQINLCFISIPFLFDTVSNDASGMAAFSSRGPADDGRIKPDIVAPGTNILSNRSHVPGASSLWAPHASSDHYTYSGGTSMAAPLTAGMGTLIREWLMTERELDAPTAALIKGVLLNTAVNTAPGQYGDGAYQEIPNSFPNSVAGWGRADLGFLLADDGFAIWFDEHEGVESGETAVYQDGVATPLTVNSSEMPLRINLVWTDPPASLSAAKQLVNDLDLVVTTPNGEVLYANAAAQPDRTNNVEGIILNNPQVGTYQIEVRGHNVPMGSQPFALVVSGDLEVGDGDEPSGTTYHLYLSAVLKD